MKKKHWGSSDPYYNIFEDWDLIVSSFLTQYGIRIYSNDFKNMKWDEFASLLSGLSEKTPLGRIVQIRAETDAEIIKNMTSSQKKIRANWYLHHTKIVPKQDAEQAMENFKNMFIAWAGEK